MLIECKRYCHRNNTNVPAGTVIGGFLGDRQACSDTNGILFIERSQAPPGGARCASRSVCIFSCGYNILTLPACRSGEKGALVKLRFRVRTTGGVLSPVRWHPLNKIENSSPSRGGFPV
ncbi:MAG: hypothetical protein CMJ81_04635 [Planctomycetaceae bacterium]|nr:hypothetical protein [Planctomycetaceae bacterium]MBP62273.1 hypothetical protein [Planctomycetaceae bacterium]